MEMFGPRKGIRASVCVCVCVVGQAGGCWFPYICEAASQNRGTPPPPAPTRLTQDLADGGVVHVGEGLQDPPALVLGPHHEGIHGSLDVARGGGGPHLNVAALARDGQGT